MKYWIIALLIFLALPITNAQISSKDLDRLEKNITESLGIKIEEILIISEMIEGKTRYSDIKVEVMGTEYQPNANGTIWLQLLRDYQPINNAECHVDAYFPNKTVFLDDETMTYLNDSDGLYYYDLIIPSTEGVYMVSSTCHVPIIGFSDSFNDYSNLEDYENITISSGKVKIKDNETLPITVGYEALLYYKMDETSGIIMEDSSGNDNDGYYVDEPILNESGTINTGTYFNGSTHANFTKLGIYDMNTSEDMAACIGINATNVESGNRVFDFYWDTGGFRIYGDNDELVLQLVRTGGVYDIKTVKHFNDGIWHKVCFITNLTTGNMYSYVDGILDKTQARAMSGSVTFPPYNFIAKADVNQYFIGGLDEICYLKGVNINITEVVDVYNSSEGCGGFFELFNYTDGYIQSNPINLIGDEWHDFDSIYDLKDGNISFKILNSTDDVLCDYLGYVSPCADSITPIKLRAELTRPYPINTSPEIDYWNITWTNETVEEIKGCGEIHVSDIACDVNATGIASDVWNYAGSITSNILNQIANSIWNWIARYTHGIVI